MFSVHIDTARTWRGGQNQVFLTVVGLRSRGHRALVIAHPDGELRRRMAAGGDLLALTPRSEMDLRAAWQLSRLVRRLGPDIVHAHDAHGAAMAALALSLAGSRRAPILVAARRVDFHVGKNAFSRWKYRQVDCFICASRLIQSMLVQDGVEGDRTTVVYEGVDLERVTRAPSVDAHAAFSLPADAPIVGNVAALVPHKGQRYLIQAAALVITEIPEARFLIVGEGELHASLAQQVRQLHLDQHVILTGFRTDVLSLHKSFDLFVMSSVTEGLGTSVLDAMACGRPIAATRAGGVPEIVVDGETGVLVPVRDAQALAAGIVRLLRDDSLRRRMGQAGRERVRTAFSAERMIDETIDVYQRLVRTSRAGDSSRLPAGV